MLICIASARLNLNSVYFDTITYLSETLESSTADRFAYMLFDRGVKINWIDNLHDYTGYYYFWGMLLRAVGGISGIRTSLTPVYIWGGTIFYAMSLGELTWNAIVQFYRKKPWRSFLVVILVLSPYYTNYFNTTLGFFGNTIRTVITGWSIFLAYQILLIELSLVAGFCTNVFSPGVGYRRSVITGMGIFPAIGSSIISALTSLEEYSTLIVVLLFFPVVFLTFYSVRGADYNFHYPVLFTLFSFGVYAAQWFPSWDSIGIEGEQRALSICHNLYFWLILLNCIYWCGWYEKRFGFHYENIENLVADFLAHWKKYISAFLTAAAISLASYRSLDSIVGIGAWKLILSKEGTQYSRERYEQDQILNHSSGKVRLEMVSEEPVLLTVPGYLLDADPEAWINQRIAEYYELEEVTGIAPGSR